MSALPAGIVPMMYAFFGADGRLELDAFRRQVRACLHAGTHGIAILGLATEVNKLAGDERSALLEAAADEVAGRVPLAVTVAGETVDAQVAFALEAERAGASCVILQPPPLKAMTEAELLHFFGAVIDAASVPVGIQNAPEYIGVGLSIEGIATLHKRHPNFRLLKGESSALLIRRTIEQVGAGLAVLNGRAGLELPDNFAAGCSGMIPGAEACDVLARVWNGLRAGGAAAQKARAEYAQVLPLLVYLMQSIDQLLCYGKRLMARRLGLEAVFDRAPAQQPTAFGLACLERHAAGLGPLR